MHMPLQWVLFLYMSDKPGERIAFEGQKENPRHFFPEELCVHLDAERSRPPWIPKIDLVVEYAEFLHEVLNLSWTVVFIDVTASRSVNQTPLEMQAEEPVTGLIRSIDRGQMAFQRGTGPAFWRLEHDDTMIVL